MTRRLLGAVLPMMVLMLGLALPATAQEKMETGVWTGTVFAPDGQMFELSYDVSYADDALAIELFLPPETGIASLLAGDPMQDGGTLVFTLDVGEVVSCELSEQDNGQYEGECIDSTGGAGLMTMIPPEDGQAEN